MRPGGLQRRLSYLLALAMGLLSFAMVVIAPAANAAVINGAITSVTIADNDGASHPTNNDNDPSTVFATDTPGVTMTYDLPASAKGGDTFTLTLPPELVPTVVPSTLKAPDGTVVATVTLDKATRTYTFTLTDYADNHDTIKGSAFFDVAIGSAWQNEAIGATAPVKKDLVFTTSGPSFTNPLAVLPTRIQTSHPRPQKTGYFTDTTDQGVTKPAGALAWRIQASDGPYDRVTISETAGAGWTIDCASIQVMLVTGYDASGYPRVESAVPAANVAMSCSTTGFNIVVNQHVNGPTTDADGNPVPAQMIRVKFTGTTTDSSTTAQFPNTATVQIDSNAPTNVSTTVRRSDAGGDGSGQQRASVGDYVWVDVNRDGLQDATDVPVPGVVLNIVDPDGQPVKNSSGAVIGAQTTDAAGHYLFKDLPLLPAGQSYTVTIDQAASAAALANYIPTTEHAGANTAIDSSTWSASSTADLSLNNSSDLTLDFGFYVKKVSVGDYVWVDKDEDGIQDAGEPGIEGVTLTITGPDGEPVTDVYGEPVEPVATGPNGGYNFPDLPALPPGQHYTVTIDPTSPALEPYLPTKTGSGTPDTDSSTGSATSGDLVNDGDKDDTLDFGFYEKKVSVGNYVWVDQDHDGVQDAGEKGIPGVTLVLTGPNGQPVTDIDGNLVGPVVTGADGEYDFTKLPTLPAGEHYTVTIDMTVPATVTALKPYAPTMTGEGTRATDSSTGSAESTDLTTDGDTDDTLDFGFYKEQVSVGNYVWVDQDHDGVQDAGEKGIPGVTLVLTGPNGQPVTDIDGNLVDPVVTGADGEYDFTKLPTLPAGEHYTVTIDMTVPATVTALKPYAPTMTGEGTRATDSSTGSAESIDLTTDGDTDDTLDFGFYKEQVSVGDYVWVDQDHDGVQDAGEPGVPGVTLVLTGPNGQPVTDIDGNLVDPVMTDTDGAYDFTKLPTLPAGEHYTVTIDQTASAEVLAPYVPTKTGQGTPATDSSTGSAESTNLTTDGDKDDTLDFGFYNAEVSVGDYVWVDQDHDGVQDAGEPGIPGVTLTLTGPQWPARHRHRRQPGGPGGHRCRR